jgi:hypothetical protein
MKSQNKQQDKLKNTKEDKNQQGKNNQTDGFRYDYDDSSDMSK